MKTKLLAVGSTLLLIAGLFTIGTMSANADGPKVTTDCTSLQVSLTGYKDHADENANKNTVKVKIDGVEKDSSSDFKTTFEKGYEFKDKDAKHTWEVDYTAWDHKEGDDNRTGSQSGVFKPCVVNDAWAKPSFTPRTCDTAQTVVGGDIKNADWETVTKSGDGNLVWSLTATATSNHKFADGESTKTFTGTLMVASGECAVKNEVKNGVKNEVKNEVGLYYYKKLDPDAAASWPNSGKQTLIGSKPGSEWFTSTTLPSGVCGPGWGYQQDKVEYTGEFTWPTNIQYPTDNIGWPPIVAAKHGELSDLVTVPACTPVVPQPKVVETYGDFGGAAPSCEVPSVDWTRTATTTTTPYKVVWQDGNYKVVEDIGGITVVTVTDSKTKTVVYDGDCTVTITAVPAGPTFTDQCGTANDTVTIPTEQTGVVYTKVNSRNGNGVGNVTVTATPAQGYVFGEGVKTKSWSHDFADVPFCDLPTHALLNTSASASNITCKTQGSYTLADTAGVQWFVNGSTTPTAAGTHKVSGASAVNVEAKLVNTVEDGWEEGAQTQWSFNFTDPADCLPTLAFTGSNGNNLGLLLAGGLLLFGGGAIAFGRRFRFNAK